MGASEWKDQTVLITGAGTGVGAALSRELAARGARVYVTARSEEKCRPVADAIRARGQTAFAETLDVDDFDAFAAVIDRIAERHGRLDVLINNAAILFVGEYDDMDTEGIERVVRTNLTSVMAGGLYAYRVMKRQGGGRIVNISSMGGFMPNASMTAYGATKYGVRGFTESLAAEAEAFGVALQVAFLGLVESEMLEKAEAMNPGALKVNEVLPFRAQPTDVAAGRIADGIERGDRYIFTPAYARLFWTLHRFFPKTVYRGALAAMRRYRSVVSQR